MGWQSLAEALARQVPQGMSMAQMAQRWILDHEAVSVVITGASREKQANGNAAVSELNPLSAELHAELRRFYETEVASNIRGPY